jgi:hypothetical protein
MAVFLRLPEVHGAIETMQKAKDHTPALSRGVGPRVVVLGAGHFGRRAIAALLTIPSVHEIVLVDHDANTLQEEVPEIVSAVCGDGIEYLDQRIRRKAKDWIVPAIPVHVAFEWLAARCRLNAVPVPQAVIRQLPHAMAGSEGQAYASNADFMCPEDCDEPAALCRVTGKPRPVVMHRHLAALKVAGMTSVVLRSRQLAPGVGGYPVAALFEMLDRARCRQGAFLLATACRCHGVLHCVGGIDDCR